MGKFCEKLNIVFSENIFTIISLHKIDFLNNVVEVISFGQKI